MKTVLRSIGLLHTGEKSANGQWSVAGGQRMEGVLKLQILKPLVPVNSLWSFIGSRWLKRGTPWSSIGLFYLIDGDATAGQGAIITRQLHNWNNELNISLYLQQHQTGVHPPAGGAGNSEFGIRKAGVHTSTVSSSDNELSVVPFRIPDSAFRSRHSAFRIPHSRPLRQAGELQTQSSKQSVSHSLPGRQTGELQTQSSKQSVPHSPPVRQTGELQSQDSPLKAPRTGLQTQDSLFRIPHSAFPILHSLPVRQEGKFSGQDVPLQTLRTGPQILDSLFRTPHSLLGQVFPPLESIGGEDFFSEDKDSLAKRATQPISARAKKSVKNIEKNYVPTEYSAYQDAGAYRVQDLPLKVPGTELQTQDSLFRIPHSAFPILHSLPVRQADEFRIQYESPHMLSVPSIGNRTDAHGSLFYHTRDNDAETIGGTRNDKSQAERAARRTESAKPVEHKTETSFKKVDMSVKKPAGQTSGDPSLDPVQLNRIVNQVYDQLERKFFHERRRMGL